MTGKNSYYEKRQRYERGDIDFQNANNVVAVKWFDNRGVTMFGRFLEHCNKVSTVTCKVKG